jgi:hypothetical protein
MIECVCAELHCIIRKEIGAKLEKDHRHDHVPKSAERSHEGKVTTLWNQQCELTEPFLTTKGISQSVITKRECA